MIFITLGSQKFQFNRLLKAVDDIIFAQTGYSKAVDDIIFAQTGYSDYQPQHYKYKHFLDKNEFECLIEQADIVITHGGTGAIIGAVKKGKKVIAIPRLAKYGEHVDNHQVQLVNQFKELGLIYACEDMDLEKALYTVKKMTFKTYISNTETIIWSLEEFIEN